MSHLALIKHFVKEKIEKEKRIVRKNKYQRKFPKYKKLKNFEIEKIRLLAFYGNLRSCELPAYTLNPVFLQGN